GLSVAWPGNAAGSEDRAREPKLPRDPSVPALKRRRTFGNSGGPVGHPSDPVASGQLGDRLENLLRDVEVRVDVLDVVALLELIDEPQDLLCSRLVRDLDGRLRHHGQLRGLDREARAL